MGVNRVNDGGLSVKSRFLLSAMCGRLTPGKPGPCSTLARLEPSYGPFGPDDYRRRGERGARCPTASSPPMGHSSTAALAAKRIEKVQAESQSLQSAIRPRLAVGADPDPPVG